MELGPALFGSDVIYLVRVCILVWWFLLTGLSLLWCLLNRESEGRSNHSLWFPHNLQFSRPMFCRGFCFLYFSGCWGVSFLLRLGHLNNSRISKPGSPLFMLKNWLFWFESAWIFQQQEAASALHRMFKKVACSTPKSCNTLIFRFLKLLSPEWPLKMGLTRQRLHTVLIYLFDKWCDSDGYLDWNIQWG